MSRVLPILLDPDMVPAILDGRKTVIRLVIKPQLEKECTICHQVHDEYIYDANAQNIYCAKCRESLRPDRKAPFEVEDTLYVRESWRVGEWYIHKQMMSFDYKDGTCGELVYIRDKELFEKLVNQSRADAEKAGCKYNTNDFYGEEGESPCRWRPPIHMNETSARIFLKVKNVRVERLQKMDYNDAIKEGIDPRKCQNLKHTLVKFQKWWNASIKKRDIRKYGWKANPWVWIIEFEMCDKPEKF